MDKNGGPAFPRPAGNNGEDDSRYWKDNDAQPGMTLRDYFAATALKAMRLKLEVQATAHDGGCTVDQIGEALIQAYAKEAYRIADALIAERAKDV